jgi:hypothetical protein
MYWDCPNPIDELQMMNIAASEMKSSLALVKDL